MTPETPHHAGTAATAPELHIPEPRPFYKRPLVYGAVVVLLTFGSGFWAYSQHPEWLTNIVEEDASGRRNLEDLPEGTNPEDLSFLFGEFEDAIPPAPIESGNERDRREQPSLLDQFMQRQDEAQEDSNDEPSAAEALARLSANNPLLNPQTNRDGEGSGAPANAIASVSALNALLNGVSTGSTGNPLQDALNQATQADAAANQNTRQAPVADNPASGATSNLNVDLYTGRPLPAGAASAPYAIPGQASGGYNALQPNSPGNPYYPSTPGQAAPLLAPSSTVPLRSQRRSTVTPLLTPVPSAPVQTAPPANTGAVPGQQFTSPIRQQQQLRSPNAGTNPNQFRRVGGGQINTLGNPLGTSGSTQQR